MRTGSTATTLTATLDGLPGRPAREIFDALGLNARAAITATARFLKILDELNLHAPPVAYPDADTTLRELAAQGAQLMLSTGSSPERAKRVLDREGWDGFTVVLGSDDTCSKGNAHYDRFAQETPDREWTQTRGHGRRQPAGHAPRRGPRRAGPDRHRSRRRPAAAVSPPAQRTLSARWQTCFRSSHQSGLRLNACTRADDRGRPRMSVQTTNEHIAFSPCRCYELAKWREHGCNEW